jgi:hypothetical protein
MGHELTPREGQSYLETQEVVRRLRTVFRYVDADTNRATVELEEGIRHMLTAREIFTDEQIEKARRARGQSIDVIVADDPDTVSLRFLIEPNESVFIGYESGEQEETAQPLLERVAQVLDYEIELV